MLDIISRRLGGSGEDHRPLLDWPQNTSKKDLAQFITAQIREEWNLSSVRMNWNLTFQGFAVAGYAVLATAEKSSSDRFLIQVVVAIFASVIALTTWQALLASQHQRNYLKKAWNAASLSLYFPEPFSNPDGSRRGRKSAQIICFATLLMWLFLGLVAIFLGLAAIWCRNPNDEPDKVQVQVAGSLQLRSALTGNPPTLSSPGTTPEAPTKAKAPPTPKKVAS